MTCIVFLGPTLSPDQGRRHLRAEFRPPVARGDVYRAARALPSAIGIVDGFFMHTPSVWHQEILWALSRGIPVFGSASMGALRAAELAAFGMQGVGWVFEAFRDGLLEDDDEVALVHGPAEMGYAPISEPMVNIRRTLEVAEAIGVVNDGLRQELVRIAKALYFPERTYARLLSEAEAAGLPPGELTVLRAWPETERIDQKREDAILMLQTMRKHLVRRRTVEAVEAHVEHTVYWEAFAKNEDRSRIQTLNPQSRTPMELLLEELALDPLYLDEVRDGLMRRTLGLVEGRFLVHEVTSAAVAKTAMHFRHANNLTESAAFRRWLRDNQLTPREFDELMRKETLVHRAESQLQEELSNGLADYLRLRGDFHRLISRARKKDETLARNGLRAATLANTGLTLRELVIWFLHCHGSDGEGVAERAAALEELTSINGALLTRAIVREYLYERTFRSTETGPRTLAKVSQ